MPYRKYMEEIKEDVLTCLENMNAQPILFIGSGLSKRYFNAPNWEQLLIDLADMCPKIDKKYAYYKQSHSDNIEIGQVFSGLFMEWAWTDGNNEFNKDLFEEDMPSDIYIKYKIKEIFEKITPKTVEEIPNKNYIEEIRILQSVNPHAIVTTNYDQFLECVFPEYYPVIGQKILKSNAMSVGEIYKIHGCVTEPRSLIFNKDDYDDFIVKKKYLSAKLLTYFMEHPLLLIGYNAEDPNIKAILSDIDEIISSDNELIPNIYILEWSSTPINGIPPRERLISIDGRRSIRVKSIHANEFDWVFELFATNSAIDNVNPKFLRALLARTYNLIRSDIPKKKVEIDFETLERVTSSDEEFAKLYGITTLGDPEQINATYPYSLTDVGRFLGYAGWYQANELIKKVEEEKDYRIKESDNKYHIAIKAGSRTTTRKYSEKLVGLLKRVKDNLDYYIDEN
ncbi:SIR2 family protein [uncultured Robinsoniella sp.]|uniref:SIR2 family protein n=1 Tax=uncultured Robinsoniella sp. TaxID=904190 RepID=UPI00374E934D